MAWFDLASDISDEFLDAQAPLIHAAVKYGSRRCRPRNLTGISASDARLMQIAATEAEIFANELRAQTDARAFAATLRGRQPAYSRLPHARKSSPFRAHEYSVSCHHCNNAFSTRRRNVPRYCSTACVVESRRSSAINRCLTCSKPFGVYNRHHRYCSKTCRVGLKPLVLRACRVCSGLFSALRDIEIYCSKPCRTKAKVVGNKTRVDAARSMRPCGICGVLFPQFHKRKVCGDACRGKWIRQKQRQLYADRRTGAAA